MNKSKLNHQSYAIAKEQFANIGVIIDKAIEQLERLKISLGSWHTDDVDGFGPPDSELGGGGIQVTGNIPGKAITIAHLRQDIEKVLSLVTGRLRINLLAIYGDFQNEKAGLNQIEIQHFQSWNDWTKNLNLGIDFNLTCFSHPFDGDGFTLSSKNETENLRSIMLSDAAKLLLKWENK